LLKSSIDLLPVCAYMYLCSNIHIVKLFQEENMAKAPIKSVPAVSAAPRPKHIIINPGWTHKETIEETIERIRKLTTEEVSEWAINGIAFVKFTALVKAYVADHNLTLDDETMVGNIIPEKVSDGFEIQALTKARKEWNRSSRKPAKSKSL
jgi:hypothetical protein